MAAVFSQLPELLAQTEPPFESWRRPAAIMVLLAEKPAPSVLLIQRPDSLTHHAGQIACPGGTFDQKWDRTLWDAASRETQEEVGIVVSRRQFAGYLDPVYIAVTGYTLIPAVARLGSRPQVTPNPGEVASYHWVELAELARVRRVGRLVAEGVSYRVPEFPLSWGLLWGATARVMGQLLAVAGRDYPANP